MKEPMQFDYRGRHVVIETRSVGDRWHWSYRIDDSSPFELQDTGESSQERAVMYASNDARSRIDNMG